MAPPNKKLKSDLTPPTAVLDDEYYKTVDLADAYIGRICDKSHIDSVLHLLKSVLPMPSRLAHLKRVKGNEVILTLADEKTEQDCLGLMKQHLNHLEDTIRSIKVPLGPLKTKKQHLEASSYWSCIFRPDKTVESMLSDDFFTRQDLVVHYNHMETAIKAAKENVSVAAAVVVDPKTNQIVATGCDNRTVNPAHHAVITALDQVAKTHCEILPQLLARCEDKDKDDIPYLCTGYDIYTTREPCLVCAMAMVHCRVRRVFYGCSNPNGALGSKTKLHVQKQLNHRYLVFKGILNDQCELLSS